jgi:uncharacterized protein YbjT (DUF2867 family)
MGGVPGPSFTSDPDEYAMIVVTGATGTIGRELVRLLAASDEPVRALSRVSPRGEAAGRTEWAQVDLADRSALAGALAGGSRLFLLTGNSEDMVRLQKNAIRAAVDAGVQMVVKLSALGATDHSRSVIGLWHFNVERELRGSGLAWTVLRPHSFMQNFLDPLVLERSAGVVRSAAGDGAIPFIDTRDIAAVSARVLREPDGHEGQTYIMTGPEALSYAEATGAIGRAIGRALTHAAESTDEAWARRRCTSRGRLISRSTPGWIITPVDWRALVSSFRCRPIQEPHTGGHHDAVHSPSPLPGTHGGRAR